MVDSDSGYGFGSGIGDDEVARLEVQGAALAPATRQGTWLFTATACSALSG
jgi:hypothetical protein